MRKRHHIQFPREELHSLKQDEVFFHLIRDGKKERIRFHEYDKIYNVPGLYEQLFYDRLKCTSPAKVADILRKTVEANGQDATALRVLDLGAGNGMMGEALKRQGWAEVEVFHKRGRSRTLQFTAYGNATSLRQEEGWAVRLAFLRGHTSLSDLSLRFPGHRDGAAVAYLLSYTAVEQLLESGGEAGLRALFDGLAAGRPFDETLRTVYGLTADQFETRWKQTVSSRYGTLYVLSRAALFWIAITLLVLWVGSRRRRRDRAKLDRMRREEMESAAAGLPMEIIDWIPPDPDDWKQGS